MRTRSTPARLQGLHSIPYTLLRKPYTRCTRLRLSERLQLPLALSLPFTKLADCLQIVRSFPANQVAEKSFRLHDSNVRFFRYGNQIVADVAFDQARVTPVKGHADLMDRFPVNGEHLYSGRNQGMRFNSSARRYNRHPFARCDGEILRQLQRDLAKHLGLQLRQVRESS